MQIIITKMVHLTAITQRNVSCSLRVLLVSMKYNFVQEVTASLFFPHYFL